MNTPMILGWVCIAGLAYARYAELPVIYAASLFIAANIWLATSWLQ